VVIIANIKFYNILSATGNMPEDLIGEYIIDVYYDKDYGLCLGMKGFLLAKQKEVNQIVEDMTIRKIMVAENLNGLKRLFNAKSFLKRTPIKKFPLTYEMLWLTPKDVLNSLITALVLAREANMTCDWIDLNKI